MKTKSKATKPQAPAPHRPVKQEKDPGPSAPLIRRTGRPEKQEQAGLETRVLGRTGRRVTTLGLGGQASLMLTPPGVDPVAIISKAHSLGITYFDTSNAYGSSQANYHKAFSGLNLIPGVPGYDLAAREGIFLASKTHMRTAKHPPGEAWRNDYSDGQRDGFAVTTAMDDVRRALSIMFGDGKGSYPGGAYLDLIQIHDLTALDDVNIVYRGLDDPNPDEAWIGALAGLLDLREGTNRSGTNPKREKLVRHIGITGHFDAAAHIEAIQRDDRRILDTLLVALNPADVNFFSHQLNSVPVAAAAGMGIIAMKVFVEAVFYGEPPTFQRTPANVFLQVGKEPVESADLIRYALSIDGVSLAITGIGRIDDDPSKCQLESNLAAAQLKNPLTPEERAELERRIDDAGLGYLNNYMQRTAVGLTGPRNFGAESDTAGFSPATPQPRPAVRLRWDTAYAGRSRISHYVVQRDAKSIGTVPHLPQWRREPFAFEDAFGQPEFVGSTGDAASDDAALGWTKQPPAHECIPAANTIGPHRYTVLSVDEDGNAASSLPIKVGP